MDTATDLKLGPCCHCQKSGPSVRNVVMMTFRAPAPGSGWGCLECRLPNDGALAVLCDECFNAKEEPIYIVAGPMGEGDRLTLDGYERETFDHLPGMHPEPPAAAWLNDERAISGKAGHGIMCAVPERGRDGEPIAALALALIDMPGFHPAWRQYAFIVGHLREMPGREQPHRFIPTATHELLLVAINPDEPSPLPDEMFSLRYLVPENILFQCSLDGDDATADERARALHRSILYKILAGEVYVEPQGVRGALDANAVVFGLALRDVAGHGLCVMVGGR